MHDLNNLFLKKQANSDEKTNKKKLKQTHPKYPLYSYICKAELNSPGWRHVGSRHESNAGISSLVHVVLPFGWH